MAIYGLETETTTHLKGMQVGDSQPDTGGGINNAITCKTSDVRLANDGKLIVVTSTIPEGIIDEFVGFYLFSLDDSKKYADSAAKAIFVSSIAGYEDCNPYEDAIGESLIFVYPMSIYNK